MNTTLILIGVGCIIGAIVGGGVRLVQIELSPVASLWRQMILGGFGIVLVIAGIMVGAQTTAPDHALAQTAGASDDVAGSPTAAASASSADDQAGPDYVIPDSQTRLLTVADLAGLSPLQLERARNEIYARHGRKFKKPAFSKYFSSKAWYHPQYDDVTLTPLETANVNLIAETEKSGGQN